jgi:hypothetical protein
VMENNWVEVAPTYRTSDVINFISIEFASDHYFSFVQTIISRARSNQCRSTRQPS